MSLLSFTFLPITTLLLPPLNVLSKANSKHMLGTNKTHVHDENLGLSFDKKNKHWLSFLRSKEPSRKVPTDITSKNVAKSMLYIRTEPSSPMAFTAKLRREQTHERKQIKLSASASLRK